MALPSKSKFIQDQLKECKDFPADTRCNVCLETFQDGEEAVKVMHSPDETESKCVFHMLCIKSWFNGKYLNRGTCPNDLVELFEPPYLTEDLQSLLGTIEAPGYESVSFLRRTSQYIVLIQDIRTVDILDSYSTVHNFVVGYPVFREIFQEILRLLQSAEEVDLEGRSRLQWEKLLEANLKDWVREFFGKVLHDSKKYLDYVQKYVAALLAASKISTEEAIAQENLHDELQAELRIWESKKALGQEDVDPLVQYRKRLVAYPTVKVPRSVREEHLPPPPGRYDKRLRAALLDAPDEQV